MAVILDLDQTLIDSRMAEPLRRSRQWQKVYEMIPAIPAYAGIDGLLGQLNEREVCTCIVTSAPRPYCEKVLQHHQWQITSAVCYHDTSLHKPHPAPILLALARLGAEACDAISVGDDAKDILASKAAGVVAVASLWGTLDRAAVLDAEPDIVCERVDDLVRLLAEA